MKKLIIFLLISLILLPVITACNLTTPLPLPHSMKGYELYSWQEEGQWHFTLITGTNRNKTLEEITTGETKEGEDGWVDIHVTGVATIKDVLSRVPANEWVSWSAYGTVGPPEEGELSIPLELPPQSIIDEIKAHALKCHLDFLVFGD
jgi:predicted small lipoprotein YifL